MERENREDQFAAMADEYADYTVYDMHYDKIGTVDDLFVDEDDRPEYVGVKTGLLGTRSTLIPMDLVTVDERQKALTVQAQKGRVKDGPSFDDDREITPEYERQVGEYYGIT